MADTRLATAGPLDADAVLLGVPYDGTSGRWPLQSRAPGLVRSALGLGSPRRGVEEDASVVCWDAGDVLAEPVAFEPTDARVRSSIQEVRSRAPQALVTLLGGEHTISLSAVRALQPATIVSLDAHPDLWDEENGRSIAHGTWLRRAIEETGCRAVLPFARAARGAEADAIDELDVEREIGPSLPEPVYLSVDVDVFDPSDAPSVVFPEPGGPPVEEVLDLVERVATRYELCGVDVVEVNAKRTGPTARLAARAMSVALDAAPTVVEP